MKQFTDYRKQFTEGLVGRASLSTVNCPLSTSVPQRGFVLLIAVLVASLMLVLASSMFNLVQKEIILASLGRDSQYAFYTADSALECALYWDFQQQAFSFPSGGPTIVCNGVTVGSVAYVALEQPMEFQFDSEGYCSKVTVIKHATYPRTTIQARGYNGTCAGLATNPRSLERAVAVNY